MDSRTFGPDFRPGRAGPLFLFSSRPGGPASPGGLARERQAWARQMSPVGAKGRGRGVLKPQGGDVGSPWNSRAMTCQARELTVGLKGRIQRGYGWTRSFSKFVRRCSLPPLASTGWRVKVVGQVAWPDLEPPGRPRHSSIVRPTENMNPNVTASASRSSRI